MIFHFLYSRLNQRFLNLLPLDSDCRSSGSKDTKYQNSFYTKEDILPLRSKDYYLNCQLAYSFWVLTTKSFKE